MQHHFLSFRWLLVGFGFICASVLPGQTNAACQLRVGWDNWPPYITYENGQFHGLEYDLLKSTADAAGCKLDMIQVPWVRALNMLGVGSLDLLYGAGYSEERATFARYSVPYRLEQFVLVTKDEAGDGTKSVSLNDWIQSSMADKTPRRLGLFRGNIYGEKMERILKNNEKNVTLNYLGSNEQMINMLAFGRLDGFIVEDGVARVQIPASSYPLQRFILEEQVADPLHYMFSLEIANDVIQRFNAAIMERQQQLPQ